MKALLVSLLMPLAAGAQSEAPHQVLEKIKAIGLSLKTRDRLEPMIENAIAGWEQHDPRSPEYAQTLTMLGMIRQSRADMDMSQLRANVEPLYRKALAIYARSFAMADDADLALTCELQAWVLATIGEVMDATPLSERAATIRKARVRELQEGYRRVGAAFKAGHGISAPVPASRVEPEYTELARFVKKQGAVKLRFVVDQNGAPQDISLTSSLGFGLDENAVRALRAWRFQPGHDENGEEVPVILRIEMDFHLL